MSAHLQILATGFYGMAQSDGLSPLEQWAYERIARACELARWCLAGSLRRNLIRERATDVADLSLELERLGIETRRGRQLAKVIVADRKLRNLWVAYLGGAH